jgi:hypothetical protein
MKGFQSNIEVSISKVLRYDARGSSESEQKCIHGFDIGTWQKEIGDLAVNGIILLNCILKRVSGCDLGSSGSALCQRVGCCKHDNEPSSYIKCRKFLWLGEEVFAFQ